MAQKLTYEALTRRVKALEIEIAEQDREKEALQKTIEETEYRMESRATKLVKANQQLKQEKEGSSLFHVGKSKFSLPAIR